MEEIFNNLTELEQKIVDYVCSANKVRMSDILNYIKELPSSLLLLIIFVLCLKELNHTQYLILMLIQSFGWLFQSPS